MAEAAAQLRKGVRLTQRTQVTAYFERKTRGFLTLFEFPDSLGQRTLI